MGSLRRSAIAGTPADRRRGSPEPPAATVPRRRWQQREWSPCRNRVQKLHLVGFTTDHKGLILSARRGARSGGFQVALDEALVAAVQALQASAGDGDDDTASDDGERPPRPRVESALPVREIQARLRQGRTVQEVARAAGVEPAWVERFAPPVFAEQAQIVAKVRKVPLRRARLGTSAHAIGDAVRRNLAARGVAMSPEEFADAWSTRQLTDGRWAVRFGFRHRNADHVLRFDLDERTGEVVPADRQSALLGYVAPPPATPSPADGPRAGGPSAGGPRADVAPAPRPVARRPTVTTGFRPDDSTTRAVSRPAKERARANAAMRKAAAQRVVATERAAARRAKEKQLAAVRRERAARVEEARKGRQRVAAEKAKAAAAARKVAAARKAAAERARQKEERLAAAQARRAEAALQAAERAAERTKVAQRAAADKAAARAAATATRVPKAAKKATKAAPRPRATTRTNAPKRPAARKPTAKVAKKATAPRAVTTAATASTATRRPRTPPAPVAPPPTPAPAPPTSVVADRAAALVAPAVVSPPLPEEVVVPQGFVAVPPPNAEARVVRMTTAPPTRPPAPPAPTEAARPFDIEVEPEPAADLDATHFDDWYSEWLVRQPTPTAPDRPRRTRPLRAT